MNQSTNRPASARFVPLLGACLALAAPLMLQAAPAAAANPCPTTRGSLDARLSGLADRGVAPFVQYVHRTRMIHQLDVAQALDRVAAYREKTAACKALFD